MRLPVVALMGIAEADTEGCLLFGLRRTQTSVSESRKAIDWLYDHLHAHGLGTITIERASPVEV